MKSFGRRAAACVVVVALAAVAAAETQALSRPLAPMDSLDGLEAEGLEIVADGPGGQKVALAEGAFSARIDLARLGLNVRDYDLIKLEVKADRGSFVCVSLENYPEEGELSHWYVLDSARGAFDWRTIWVDLRRPEEIKEAGTYKGMASEDPGARGVRIRGSVIDLNRKAQGADRRVRLGAVRLVRQAVHLDWDQRQAPYAFDEQGGLTFRYPLTVTNRLDRPVRARLELLPLKEGKAAASLSEPQVALEAGQTKTVEARVSLPAAAVKEAPPLYCEFFEARASAEGVDDSAVTILRSSDPIHLPVVVPPAEEKLAFPLLLRCRDVPSSVTGFDPGRAQDLAEAKRQADASGPADLDAALDAPLSTRRQEIRGFNYWGSNDDGWRAAGWRYLTGVTACAFLYDYTGEKAYHKKGTAMLLRAAELFVPRREEWRKLPCAVISHGIFSVNTLSLGWSTGGMRPPYLYEKHGLFNAFDLLAADMDEASRRKIIDGFLLPAAIHMRNHYFGLSNQQDVVNYPVMYAGMAARNWPLVAHAYCSEHGVVNQIAWAFSDDGLAAEGNYHAPSIDPILYAAELLRRVGVDLYDQRLYEIVHSRGAEAIGKAYNRSIVPFLDAQRFPPEARRPAPAGPAGGQHLATGLTMLRWGDLEVAMNWDMQMNRSAPDRCALRIAVPERNPLAGVGGGNYTHSSLGQSIIIIDEGRQDPVGAEVLAYDVEGPVQFVQARSDRHYPGSTITRTFALLGDVVVAIDRAVSDRPRTVDWCLRYRGDWEEVAKSIELEMKRRDGSFTDKPDDAAHGVTYGAKLRSGAYCEAAADAMWRQRRGELTMAAAPGTRVLVFAVGAAFSAARKERESGVPVMMVRRAGVKKTDFVAALSPQVKSVEQAAVTKAGGGPAEAVGAVLTFRDGSSCRVVVNYEPPGTKVQFGPLVTDERFATDYKGK